jgi:hypothetical protein
LKVEETIKKLKAPFDEAESQRAKETSAIIGIAGYSGAYAIIVDVIEIFDRAKSPAEFIHHLTSLNNKVKDLGSIELKALKKDPHENTNFGPAIFS